jgi:hypothetical protein
MRFRFRRMTPIFSEGHGGSGVINGYLEASFNLCHGDHATLAGTSGDASLSINLELRQQI